MTDKTKAYDVVFMSNDLKPGIWAGYETDDYREIEALQNLEGKEKVLSTKWEGETSTLWVYIDFPRREKFIEEAIEQCLGLIHIAQSSHKFDKLKPS